MILLQKLPFQWLVRLQLLVLLLPSPSSLSLGFLLVPPPAVADRRCSVLTKDLCLAAGRVNDTADQRAEALEKELIFHKDAAKVDVRDYVDCLKAWMVAFEESDTYNNDLETKVWEYGIRMEDLLTHMEEQQRKAMITSTTTIEPYSIVTQMYLKGDPMAALRVLSRMENHLCPADNEDLLLVDRFQQYNCVLQGLGMDSPTLCSLIGVRLLTAMVTETAVDIPRDEQVEPFLARGLCSQKAMMIDAFTIVLSPLLQMNQKLDAFLKPICDLLQQANKAGLFSIIEDGTNEPITGGGSSNNSSLLYNKLLEALLLEEGGGLDNEDNNSDDDDDRMIVQLRVQDARDHLEGLLVDAELEEELSHLFQEEE